MKNIAIVSYNIRCNFTNYGSALQSWALKEVVKKIGEGNLNPILVDYCPNSHIDCDPLNPFKNMWDKDEKSINNCKLSMPAIKINYKKFDDFYTNRFNRTKKMYTSNNFNEISKDENVNSFICGADTIFCVDEFGMDEVYYANKKCMKDGYTFSYAASFGDSHFNDETYKILNQRLNNFKAIGIREAGMIDYIKEHVDNNIDVERVIDPTLLLTQDDYEEICSPQTESGDYLLLYARRGNKIMDEYAENLAREKNLRIIEISLNALNKDIHTMRYDAGVEEFLTLVKNAKYVVTNSYHGMIFATIFRKPFVIFSREQCDTKIVEVLNIMGLEDRLLINETKPVYDVINYDDVFDKINVEKEKSIRYLKKQLNNIHEEDKNE